MLPINWTAFKSYIDAKGISIQWAEDESYYYMIAVDSGVAIFSCQVSKTLAGAAADLAAFEATYKAAGNKSTFRNGSKSGGVNGALSLTTGNTAYEVKVGASRLTYRRFVTVTPNADVYWGYSNAVTTSNGSILYANQSLTIEVENDSTQIWIVCATSSKSAQVTEAP